MKKNTKLTIKFFAKHIGKNRRLASFMAFTLTTALVIELFVPFLFRDFFNILTSTPGSQLAEELIVILLKILGLNMISWIFWRFSEFSADYLWSRSMANIRNEIFVYLHQHSYAFFTSNFVGALVKKAGKLVNAFESIIGKMYWDIWRLTIISTGSMIILFTLNTTIGMVMLSWTIAFLTFNYLFANFKMKYDLARSEADTKITATFADTITNNINLKIFTSHSLEEEEFAKVNEDWRKKARFTWNLGSALDASQVFLIIILEFLLFYFSVKFWEKGQLNLGDFILVQSYILQIIPIIWNFGRTIRAIYQDFSDAEEMIEILNTPHAVKDLPEAKKLEVKKGEIKFQNISFNYGKGKNVIDDLDLTIKPGEKIALIGPSGGGKSTIVKLLFRFFDVNEGKILIDQQDIKYVTQKSLRKNLSLVPQDPILFHRSLLKNIRYGQPQATDEEVIEAAKLANCHQFISQFPEGYKTYVGERGVKLSGGERQRVAIARAILKNAPILVLDEATSSLDSESEMLIQQALERLMKGKTTIVIAHRLSTIMKMDRIIVIKEGKIVEIGTHQQLTNKEGGLYKMLWELQAGHFIQ